MSLADDLADLQTAEDFLDYFGVAADPRVVRVNRLHILQRFHDRLDEAGGLAGLDDEAAFARGKSALERAYADFAASDAVTEKVFKVHRMLAEREAATFVPLDAIRGFSAT